MREDSRPSKTVVALATLKEHFKRWTEQRLLGPRRYDKLRFIRRAWLPYYLPSYLSRRDRPAPLEDLYIFLTSACNARCRHCFYIGELGARPGELTLDDYRALAPTLPPLRRLTLTGGEAILHPQIRQIAPLLARATHAAELVIISNGFLPERLHELCAGLLADGLPGRLDILVSLDGLEPTHNAIRGNPNAWRLANETLAGLARLHRLHPDRLSYGVTTVINNRNYTELAEIHEHLRRHEGCRHGFELIRGTGFSLWGLPPELREPFNPSELTLPPAEAWDAILATLRRLNRADGLAHHAFFLTAVFAFRMLRTRRKPLDCTSAGRSVGVIYSGGDVALCEFARPLGNLREYGMDFTRAWTSPEAEARRAQLTRCFCTHGCYLSKNIENSPAGLWAMLREL